MLFCKSVRRCTVLIFLSKQAVYYIIEVVFGCFEFFWCSLVLWLFCLWSFIDLQFPGLCSLTEYLPFCRERETPPRFAQPGSFEFEYSQRWKSLDEMEKQQREQVAKNMKDAKDKLESEMEDAYHEHQANLLRQGNWFWVVFLNAFCSECWLRCMTDCLMVLWINSCFLLWTWGWWFQS